MSSSTKSDAHAEVYKTYQEDELYGQFGSASLPQGKERATLTSLRRDVANANANPAREASIVGVSTATKAIIPMTALDSRLNRADNQRFTAQRGELQRPEQPLISRTYHPTSSSTGSSSKRQTISVISKAIWGRDRVRYRRIEACRAGISTRHRRHEGRRRPRSFHRRLSIAETE